MPECGDACYTSDLMQGLFNSSIVVLSRDTPFNLRLRHMNFCLNSIETLTSGDPCEFSDSEIEFMKSLLLFIKDAIDKTGSI